MPLMDGLRLVSLVRSSAPNKSMPIVVITTEGAEADRNRAMNLGATAYLVKPVQSQQVVDAVRRLLGLP
jgi:two-component system chemotaxis response regulator CheY